MTDAKPHARPRRPRSSRFANLAVSLTLGLGGVGALSLATASAVQAGSGMSKKERRKQGQRRAALRDAAERELELTQTANALERGRVALERERESLTWAGALLDRRSRESLRKLDAYRAHRVERETLGTVRARKLYKLARGGGMLEMVFEDGAAGHMTPAERAARGRTLRALVDHDLEQLQIHTTAEREARAELLAASRELQVLGALDSLGRLQSVSLDAGADNLHPSLAAAHHVRKRLQKRVRGKLPERERRLLSVLGKERRNLQHHRGLDLLEKDALVRPVQGKVAGRYGDYKDPVLAVPMHRNGVELEAAANDAVRAIAPGRVAFVGALPGFERVVVVDHGGGYLSLTARLLTVSVEEGQDLEAGASLGRVGPKAIDDGLGTTAYVELRHGQRPIDPTPYLAPSKGKKSKRRRRRRR